jgi:ligand-binding SRPBCC domain-containing protein
MGRIHILKSIQKIPATPEEVWEFFSGPQNLFALTPPFLNLKPTGDPGGKETYAGQILTYTVKPLLGIPLFWMTEITHVERLKLFVDEQRKGPYSLWRHQHHFKPVEGGTEMTDIIHYRLPLGPLGDLGHVLFVKGRLKKIFEYRYRRVEELFGQWPGGTTQLYVE